MVNVTNDIIVQLILYLVKFTLLHLLHDIFRVILFLCEITGDSIIKEL